MSVIEEEESDRSFSDEGVGFQEWMEGMKKKFNNGAYKLQKMEGEFEKIVNVYKGQLLEMSKEMTAWEEKNQELKQSAKNVAAENQKLKIEIQDLKDQITSQAANYVLSDNIDCSEIFEPQKKGPVSSKNKSEPKIGIKQKLAEMSEQPGKGKFAGSRRASIQKINAQPENSNKENNRKV